MKGKYFCDHINRPVLLFLRLSVVAHAFDFSQKSRVNYQMTTIKKKRSTEKENYFSNNSNSSVMNSPYNLEFGFIQRH